MLELIYELARDNASLALILTVATACWYVWDYRPLKRTVEGLAKFLDAVMEYGATERLAEKNIFLTDILDFATLTYYGEELAQLVLAETIAKEYYEQVLGKENAHGYDMQGASFKLATEQLLEKLLIFAPKHMELIAMQNASFRFPIEQLPKYVRQEQMKFIDAMQEASFKFATTQLPELVTKTQMKLIDVVASNAGVKRNEILKIIGLVMRNILLRGGLKKMKGTSS